jgi:hypothetical protein
MGRNLHGMQVVNSHMEKQKDDEKEILRWTSGMGNG